MVAWREKLSYFQCYFQLQMIRSEGRVRQVTSLSVNVNKLATLRNSRGKNNPDVLKSCHDIIGFGAHGITVHPRPDERHIRKSDVYEIAKSISVEFNIEGYPSSDFIQILKDVRPAQATLVPDPPEVLTSNAGWKIFEHQNLLNEVAKKIKDLGTRVSVFVDPYNVTIDELKILSDCGVDRIELYTEAYAEAFGTSGQVSVTDVYCRVAEQAKQNGLGINAGHDLNRENLAYLVSRMPYLDEVSIGHALICDALQLGLRETIRQYLQCLEQG